MKVCTLYGAGFYYMPGTDMCIKIGGWTRAEVTDKANGNLATGPFAANTNSRATNNLTVRARGYITADAREETEFGVARAYIDVGLSTNTFGLDAASNTFSSNRAFLQWAGFTAGLSRSFFDFYNAAVQNYRAGYFPQEDTGDAGWYVWAYTAQLGGGLSATISAEERRMNQIINDSGIAAASSLAAFSRGSGFGGWQAPDIVGNIRIDQAWGSAQIMAAGHELNPLYYGPASTQVETNGGPGTNWGWVVGAGAHLNLPFIWQGDYVEGEFNYTQGAVTYLADSTGITQTNAQGGKQSWGLMSDCVYGGTVSGIGPAVNGTDCEQTSAWSAILSYEHYWTPQWHQSFTGGYMAVRYDDTANNMLCALEGQGVGGGHGSAAVARAGCDNDWNYWVVGSRLQWDVTKSFYLGVEALYLQQDSASSATGFVPLPVALGNPTLCANPTVGCRSSDNHEWVFTLRMHKDFLP